MSIPVELSDLRHRIDEFGRCAFLITANEDGGTHVASVYVRDEGEHFVVDAGKRTGANVTRYGVVTLLWAPRDDGDYALIVDGAGEVVDGSTVAIQPRSAVLHKLADASTDLPGCIAVTPPD